MTDFNRMAVFAAVVEQGSMSAAGRRLGMSTSAVSQHLRALQQSYGVTLLHRSTRKLTLTDAGQDAPANEIKQALGRIDQQIARGLAGLLLDHDVALSDDLIKLAGRLSATRRKQDLHGVRIGRGIRSANDDVAAEGVFLGDELEWDVELAIPSGAIEPVKLGKSGRLGWTTWTAPNWTSRQPYRYDARFSPADRLRPRQDA